MDTPSYTNSGCRVTASLAADRPFCLTQLHLSIAKLVLLSNKVVVKALLAILWTKVQGDVSVLKTTRRHAQAPPFLAIPELPFGQHGLGLTCHGKFGSHRVELGRTLVRIHTIPQGKLGHPLAVLLPKIVRDGCIILSSVGESLGTKWGTFVNLKAST